MHVGCTQCGECLNVCPVYALYAREEYSPKGKRLLLEPLEGSFSTTQHAPQIAWAQARDLARLCAGCGRCERHCARKLSTSDLLAAVRAQHSHWTQTAWAWWIRAAALWPLIGRAALLLPQALSPDALRHAIADARALTPPAPPPAWAVLHPVQPLSQPLSQPVVTSTSVLLFAGCTARSVRPVWRDRAAALLQTFGYTLLRADFTCCGGTLHHAGQHTAEQAMREHNIRVWHNAGKAPVVTLCASCHYSLGRYATHLCGEDARLWQASVRPLSALLSHAQATSTEYAPEYIGYHSPCHWGAHDPDWPLLARIFPQIKKAKPTEGNAGLCCGMGGILKMNEPALSARMARACIAALGDTAPHILTGCSGCALQLSAVAGTGTVFHWLDVVTTQ